MPSPLVVCGRLSGRTLHPPLGCLSSSRATAAAASAARTLLTSAISENDEKSTSKTSTEPTASVPTSAFSSSASDSPPPPQERIPIPSVHSLFSLTSRFGPPSTSPPRFRSQSIPPPPSTPKHTHPARGSFAALLQAYTTEGNAQAVSALLDETPLPQQQQEWDSCVHEPSSVSALLTHYASQHRVDLMEGLWKCLEARSVKPTSSMLTSLVYSYGRCSRLDKLVWVYGVVQTQQVTTDVGFLVALVRVYGKCQQLSFAERICEGVRRYSARAFAQLLSELIEAYTEARALAKVDYVWHVVKASPVYAPRREDYHRVLRAYGFAGRVDRMLEVRADMAAHSVAPTLDTYNVLLAAYGRLHRYDLVQEIRKEVEATHNHDDDHDQKNHDHVQPDLRYYDQLVQAYHEGCRGILVANIRAEMARRGVHPDRPMLQKLMAFYNEYGTPKCQEAANVFALYLEQHLRSPQKEKDSSPRALAVATVTQPQSVEQFHRLLVESSFSSPHNREVARQTLDSVRRKMGEAKVSPNAETYAILIECYSQHRYFDMIPTLLQEMREGGVALTTRVLNAAAAAYAPYVTIATPEFLQVTASREGVCLDQDFYLSLLTCVVQRGQVGKLPEVLEEMARAEIPYTVRIWERVLRAYNALAHFDAARRLNAQMQVHGLRPRYQTFNLILEAYLKAGYTKQAEVIVAKMAQLRFPPPKWKGRGPPPPSSAHLWNLSAPAAATTTRRPGQLQPPTTTNLRHSKEEQYNDKRRN